MSDLRARFEAKVDRSGECWIWTAAKDKDGYGTFSLRSKKTRAHRVAHEIYKGEVPLSLCVLHRCDNPSCVNPSHLFLGTHADNASDKVSKGRQPRGVGLFAKRRSYAGDGSPVAKLTAEQVVQIRSDGRLHRLIAKQYGVSRAAVSHCKRGSTWGHIA